MNSTDERRLRKFFRKKLVPIADKLRARGVRLLAVAPSPELASRLFVPTNLLSETVATTCPERANGERSFGPPAGGPAALESWYADGSQGEADFAEVEAEHCERTLREMWERQGLPELAALAADLMRLAREIEFDEAQAADVSPFLYVMY